MLGHLDVDLRDVEDLAAFGTDHRRAVKPVTAATTSNRSMREEFFDD
ncbi:hypothetical protein [Streptomyces griseofuscus]